MAQTTANQFFTPYQQGFLIYRTTPFFVAFSWLKANCDFPLDI